MKITQIINSSKNSLSFEVFPPKNSDSYDTVSKAVSEIAALSPSYMSVTYGAGGGTSEYTLDIAKNIKKLYDPKRTLSSTFYCSLLDLSHRNIVYKDLSAVESNKIPLYLKASVAMPVYNRAVQLDNTSYFDGAMIDNIPVYPLLKHSFDYIICVYFDDTCYKFENTFFDNKVIKITFPCESMLKQSVVFKKEAIDDMIKSGYDRTTHILRKVFAQGYENVEHMNQKNKGNNLRITGDVLVTNLNKITQRLTKRKIL